MKVMIGVLRQAAHLEQHDGPALPPLGRVTTIHRGIPA